MARSFYTSHGLNLQYQQKSILTSHAHRTYNAAYTICSNCFISYGDVIIFQLYRYGKFLFLWQPIQSLDRPKDHFFSCFNG